MWAKGVLPKYRKSIRRGHTFQGCWLLLILMMDLTQKYVQLIIQSLLFISMVCPIGGLPKCPKFVCVSEWLLLCEREVTVMESPIGGLPKCHKFGCCGDTFGGCWLLLILMMVSTQKYVQLII